MKRSSYIAWSDLRVLALTLVSLALFALGVALTMIGGRSIERVSHAIWRCRVATQWSACRRACSRARSGS